MDVTGERKRKRDESDDEIEHDELLGKVGALWAGVLRGERKKAYYKQMLRVIKKDRATMDVVPEEALVMNAFRLTPLHAVRVVIIGQFPGPDGLTLSRDGPVMDSICTELTGRRQKNLKGISLESWAVQGVLLLSASLTAPATDVAKHDKIGWQTFTDSVLQALDDCPPIVFLLWGGFAVRKAAIINNTRHVKQVSAHPLTVGWKGCCPFEQCNAHLRQLGSEEVRWDAIFPTEQKRDNEDSAPHSSSAHTRLSTNEGEGEKEREASL